MDGVIVTPGNNNARLKTRIRSNLARNSKNRQSSFNRSLNNHHKNNNRNAVIARSASNNNNQRQMNNINKNNNINSNQESVVSNAVYANNNGNSTHETTNNSSISCAGEFTREIYHAICPRLGHTLHIPEDTVQALFNDMHLYPSKTQVSEMLQCARQCGRRNGAAAPKYLTFGEFCVFVREMQNQTSPKQHRKPTQLSNTNTKCGSSNCDVFLGGSCNPTTWRADTAIPELQKCGITFYNPQVSMWAPELVAQEHDAKQSASVLLFVVDSQTRSTGGMIEVAYLVASGRCVVLVAHPYRPGQSIMGETITQKEYADLVEGQKSLLMLVKSRGVKVHANLSAALQCTASILRNSSNNGMTSEEQIIYKLRKLREVFDSCGGQNGEISFYNVLDAYEKLTQRTMKISELFDYLNASNEPVTTNMRITFERFCMLMAEFTADRRCDMCTTNATTTDVWVTQPFQRQCSTNNNSCNINNINDEPNNHTLYKSSKMSYDVFLGGAYGSRIKWRRDIAIPLLKKHGITYYNPVLREINGYDNNVSDNFTMQDDDDDDENMLISENDAMEFKQIMDLSKVLLFVITNDTRSLTTMILAAHYIGLGSRNVVLCIQQLPTENCVVSNETLSKQAVKDYNRGRVYLGDLAKRKQVPVFENITEAVQCTIDNYCQNR